LSKWLVAVVAVQLMVPVKERVERVAALLLEHHC
jgi:hypothetical protein